MTVIGIGLLLAVLDSSAAAEGGMIGWRHDGTGLFPADCRPVAEWDGPSGRNIAWKAPLPNHGNGGPIAVGTKVFVVCEPGWPEGVDAPLLLCFDGDTGEELWQAQVDPLDALPQDEARELKALRAGYWEGLRAANRLWARWQEADEAGKAAINAEAEKLFGSGFEKKMGFKGATEMPFGGKARRGHWRPLVKRTQFQVPAWRWTGMGPSMAPPVSDGQRVYIVNGFKFAAAYSFEGERAWLTPHFDIPYRHHWVESCGNAPLLVDGYPIAFMLDRLICYDPESGKVRWLVKTREFDGHGMGTPVALRLPVAGSDETVSVVFCQSGEAVRVSDGKVYARDIGFFDACACLATDGKGLVWANNAGSGGRWRGGGKMGKGRRFMESGPMCLRFSLDDRDSLEVEQVWKGVKVKLGTYPLLLDDRLYTADGIVDPLTGKTLSFKNTRFRSYHGLIHAGGLLIGNQRGGPPKRSGQKFAPFVTVVYRPPVDPGMRRIESFENRLEMVPDPDADEGHRKKVIAMTGRFGYRQWYGWHNSYSTPFASGNRLFIRTYDFLWCIGDPAEPFRPSAAFMPR